MKIPRILQKSERISRKQNIINWLIVFGVLAILAYVIPMWFIGNGVAQITQSPEEKYYAEKVLEYRKKYLDEHGFKQPLILKVTERKPEALNKDELYHSGYHCGEIPEAHFDGLYDKVYKYIYYTKGYSWFGVEDRNAGDLVMGCALYKVGV